MSFIFNGWREEEWYEQQEELKRLQELIKRLPKEESKDDDKPMGGFGDD